jgi:hypothetical protein
MTVHNESQVQSALTGGVIAGLVAGLVLWLFILATSALAGQEIWLSMKVPGAPFLGERALQPGFDASAVIVGRLTHFAISTVWGMLFATLSFGLGRTATLLAGLAWGIVVWVGMFYLLVPLLGLADIARDAPIPLAILQHVLFGLVLAATFLPFQHELPRGRHTPGAARSVARELVR